MDTNTTRHRAIELIFSRKLLLYSERRFIRFCLMLTLTAVALCSCPPSFATNNIVNIYTWAEEIPAPVIAQFEQETGIKVNYTSFDSNEMMYAKLHATHNQTYDIIEPSSYYVDRMWHQNLLEKLDKSKLPNFKYLDTFFINQAYDPKSTYSLPFIWGITSIFINKNYFSSNQLTSWLELYNKQFTNQLMLLDDPREAFSMALLILGYSINDTNPEHIKQAYLKLRQLMPNVRMFNTDAVISIIIDEDAGVGLSWNGDLYKASLENPNLEFIYPKEGFEIWVDNFVIMQSAPHKENAYKLLNFLMRPEIAKTVSLSINYSTANKAAKNLMPPEVKNNPVLYPSKEILARGQFETDIGDKTFGLMEKYWEQLKMGG